MSVLWGRKTALVWRANGNNSLDGIGKNEEARAKLGLVEKTNHHLPMNGLAN